VNCTKCGAEVPSQSRFCPSCGQAVTRQGVPAPSSKKRVGLYAAISALVVAAAFGAWYLRGRGVTQATPVPNPQQSPVLNAPGTPNSPQANVLQSNAKGQPLNLDSAQKPPPPADVVAYLEHLKAVDAAREGLQRKWFVLLLNAAPKDQKEDYEKLLNTNPEGKMEELGTHTELKKTAANMDKEWQALCQKLLSLPAPETCASLSGKYYDALRDVIKQNKDDMQAFENNEVGTLLAAYLDKTHTSIDDKLEAADRELASVCSRYGIQKSFTIKSARSVPGLMGSPF